MTPSSCLCCGHDGEAAVHAAREMMFGLGGSFSYRECPDCGALQLLDPPADMAPWYPEGYYSYAVKGRRPVDAVLDLLKRRRARAWFGGFCPLGSMLLRLTGPTPRLRWLRILGVDHDASILDVGCGDGDLLLEMRREGFRDLCGADPFVTAEIDHGDGLRVLKAGLPDLDGAWDLIMMHHSLEHMPDPGTALRDAVRLLEPGGGVLVRTPVADAEAWHTYGVDWVQLDAPRHLVLPTRAAMNRLAAAAGLEVVHEERDGTAFQFWGSEQYRRGIPLRSPSSHAEDPAASPFEAADLARWDAEAARLNAAGRGDQAVYLLRRSR